MTINEYSCCRACWTLTSAGYLVVGLQLGLDIVSLSSLPLSLSHSQSTGTALQQTPVTLYTLLKMHLIMSHSSSATLLQPHSMHPNRTYFSQSPLFSGGLNIRVGSGGHWPQNFLASRFSHIKSARFGIMCLCDKWKNGWYVVLRRRRPLSKFPDVPLQLRSESMLQFVRIENRSKSDTTEVNCYNHQPERASEHAHSKPRRTTMPDASLYTQQSTASEHNIQSDEMRRPTTADLILTISWWRLSSSHCCCWWRSRHRNHIFIFRRQKHLRSTTIEVTHSTAAVTMTTDSDYNTVSYEFLGIHRTRDYIWLNSYYCTLV